MQDTDKSWFERNWKWFLPVLFLAVSIVYLAMFAGLALAVFHIAKSSDVYQLALREVQTHQQVREMLGVPIEPGWYVTGDINLRGRRGDAKLEIPVSGSRQDGSILLEAEKTDGQWLFNSLIVESKDARQRIIIY